MNLALVATLSYAAKQDNDFTGNLQASYTTGTDVVIDQENLKEVNAVVGNQEVQQEAVFWGERADDWQPTLLDIDADFNHDWFNQAVMPFYNLHKGQVYQNAIDRAVEEHGVLSKTCAKGTACRDEKRKNLKTELQTQWKQVMKSFKQTVANNVQTTQDKIVSTYEEFKKCADDNPCCTTSETTVKNWYTEMENFQRAIYKRRIAIKELNARITEIEVECPEVIDVDVQILETTPDLGPDGVCWVKMPTGCERPLNQAIAADYEFIPGADFELNWLAEDYHLQDNSLKEYACGQVAIDAWNLHCLRDDAKVEWHVVGERPIETAPDLGPDGVCWVKMPTGCDRGLNQADAAGYEFQPGAKQELIWLAEDYHLEYLSAKEFACGQKAEDAWNTHCQRTDAIVEWHVNGEMPVETAPDLGPDGICWVKMPTGCNKALGQAQAVGYEFILGREEELIWLAETLPQHLEDSSPKEYACGQKTVDAWNTYCERTDAKVEWTLPDERPIETAPDKGPDGVCWIKMPTGCDRALAQAAAVGYEYELGAREELDWLAETVPYLLVDSSPKEYACGTKATDEWNKYCQRDDAIFKWTTGEKPSEDL